MTAFDNAFTLLKVDVDINTCAGCYETVPTVELENPYNPPSTNLCKKCWHDEMNWRMQQQRKHPNVASRFPILPWPLEGYE
jgi:DNA-directed RNA polymerase subunit M/transcription elongation factor TFIIS